MSSSSSQHHLHLLWGVVHYFLYVLLAAMCSPIFRASSSLSTTQAFQYLFIGESLSTLPVLPIAIRRWTVSSPADWTTYLTVGFLINANFLMWRTAAAVMPLGDYAAIDACGVLFAPLVSALLRRRCVGLIDAIGAAFATLGIALVTRPTFLFRATTSTAEMTESVASDVSLLATSTLNFVPVYAYFFALYGGLLTMALPFIFAKFDHLHWSNFICIRVLCSAMGAFVCYAISGFYFPETFDDALATSGVFLVGVLSTIYRLVHQCACVELEELGSGTAGLLGNFIHAGIIPLTALFSFAFFGEALFVIETVGVVVVFVSIIGATAANSLLGEKDVSGMA